MLLCNLKFTADNYINKQNYLLHSALAPLKTLGGSKYSTFKGVEGILKGREIRGGGSTAVS